MIKRLWLFSLFCILSLTANAQFTSVTATVTDSDGQTWNAGKWSVTLYNPLPQSPANINGTPLTTAQMIQSGVMNGSGAFSLTLADSSRIAPTGTHWVFVICPQASAQCSVVDTPVSGGSQDITSIINAGITPPVFTANAIVGGAWGYRDSEVHPIPNPGGQYYNSILACQRIWDGTSWSCIGGGAVAGCSPSVFPSSVLYSPSGTDCSGDSYFTYKDYLVDINRFASLVVEQNANIQVYAPTDPSNNNWQFDGKRLDFISNGTTALGGISLNVNDGFFTGGGTVGPLPLLITAQTSRAGHNLAGVEVIHSLGGAAVRDVVGYEYDSPGMNNFGDSARSVTGYLAAMEGKAGTTSSNDLAFWATTPVGQPIGANYCDFLSSANTGAAVRGSLFCGPTYASLFNGPISLNSTVTLGAVTGSTQCLHADTAGSVTGTGADCYVPGASSIGANGYITLPGGLIEQWLTVTVTACGTSHCDAVGSLPLTYPNANFGCTALTQSDVPTGGWNVIVTSVNATTTSSVTVGIDTTQTAIHFSNNIPVFVNCKGN